MRSVPRRRRRLCCPDEARGQRKLLTPQIGDNFCDCAVNFFDLAQMKNVFFTNDANADLVGPAGQEPDGVVNFIDLSRMRELFFTQPGPSAAGCN